MKKIYKITEKIIIIIATIIGLFLLISLFPIKNNYQIKVVLSGSMEPAIHTGSLVVVKPVGQYTVGDIIIFGKDTAKSIPTTHRIISSHAVDGELLFSTKGDANNTPDVREVSIKDVRGKVLFTIPFMGYVLDFVKKPWGLTIVILIPAVYVIVGEIVKIFSEIKKMKKQRKLEKNETAKG